MGDWFSIVLDKGFTLAFAVAVLIAIAKAAKFMAPKVTEVVEAHTGLVETLKTNGQTTAECLQRQTAMMHNLGQTLDGHGNALTRHGERLDHVEGKVDEIHAQVVIKRCHSKPDDGGGQ